RRARYKAAAGELQHVGADGEPAARAQDRAGAGRVRAALARTALVAARAHERCAAGAVARADPAQHPGAEGQAPAAVGEAPWPTQVQVLGVERRRGRRDVAAETARTATVALDLDHERVAGRERDPGRGHVEELRLAKGSAGRRRGTAPDDRREGPTVPEAQTNAERRAHRSA